MMMAMLLCVVLAAADPAGGQPPTPEQLRFFETSVRPMLVEHCFKCHGEKKQWGGLRLDSRAALMRGGDSGAAIVPGKPNESRLIRSVSFSSFGILRSSSSCRTARINRLSLGCGSIRARR